MRRAASAWCSCAGAHLSGLRQVPETFDVVACGSAARRATSRGRSQGRRSAPFRNESLSNSGWPRCSERRACTSRMRSERGRRGPWNGRGLRLSAPRYSTQITAAVSRPLLVQGRHELLASRVSANRRRRDPRWLLLLPTRSASGQCTISGARAYPLGTSRLEFGLRCDRTATALAAGHCTTPSPASTAPE